MINLPQEYCDNMRELLGEDEFNEYIKSFDKKSDMAVRINTLKISVDEWNEISSFDMCPISWTDKGFVINNSDKTILSKHPYYFAGLYYIQEPSAMIPAAILPVEEGDRVLDLCAAPGGKATELAAKLNGTGILVANDISVSRAMALAKNLQMTGARNVVVTAETPDKLSEKFDGFFDKILIDALCSGEGMFRREPRMVKDWLANGPEYYSKLQKEILDKAYTMLKPGGMMVYSTCTFSVMEDEAVIQWFTDKYKDMSICTVEHKDGFSYGRPDMIENGDDSLKKCIRIFPHRSKGEGHFATLLKKEDKDKQSDSENDASGPIKKKQIRNKALGKNCLSKEKNKDYIDEINQFIKIDGCQDMINIKKDVVSLAVSGINLRGLRVIQDGLILGEIKKKFEPSPQLALSFGRNEFSRMVDFVADDIEVIKYLKGETIQTDSTLKGWGLVTVDGYPLGWCKGNGNGMLKNKYYPGWRLL